MAGDVPLFELAPARDPKMKPKPRRKSAAAGAAKQLKLGERALPKAPTVNEYRVGRGWIRVGDRVRVRPSRPGKHDAFESAVRSIQVDVTGAVTGVVVVSPKNGAVRTIRPERIQRRRQPNEATPD